MLCAATFAFWAGTGCHDPNDPNMNPKTLHALMNQQASTAMNGLVLECYDETYLESVSAEDGELLRTRTYSLKDNASLPRHFTVFYSPQRRIAWYSLNQNTEPSPQSVTHENINHPAE